jgi:hypothetical protein
MSAGRWATTLRWPFGVVLTAWSYMWRTTPFHRQEIAGSLMVDAPPPLPEAVDRDRLQPWEEGHGTLFHRRYVVRIAGSVLSAEQLMARLQHDPNTAAPSAFAAFHKVRGDEGTMRVGDEYVVRMPGPWDGPVRVVEVDPCSYRVATLDSHLEAGQIRSSATDDGPIVELVVESWGRSGDRLSDLLHRRLHIAKEVQLHMWTSFLERAVGLCEGRMENGISITTWRVDDPEEGPVSRSTGTDDAVDREVPEVANRSSRGGRT